MRAKRPAPRTRTSLAPNVAASATTATTMTTPVDRTCTAESRPRARRIVLGKQGPARPRGGEESRRPRAEASVSCSLGPLTKMASQGSGRHRLSGIARLGSRDRLGKSQRAGAHRLIGINRRRDIRPHRRSPAAPPDLMFWLTDPDQASPSFDVTRRALEAAIPRTRSAAFRRPSGTAVDPASEPDRFGRR